MIHLYAFTSAGVPLPATAGIGGASLEACTVAGVTGVCSAAGPVDREREAVVEHGLVVEALREVTGAVLPVRFGERFGSRRELTSAIREHHASLRAGLARVEGCVEFGVRMLPGDDEQSFVPEAADGTSYMRTRLASQVRADAVALELHEPLARCARASVVAPGAQHAAAYLVPNESRPAFERTVSSFAETHPEVTVLCTGPWAPYSFAGAE